MLGRRDADTAGWIFGVDLRKLAKREFNVLDGLYRCTVREHNMGGERTLIAPTFKMNRKNFWRFVLAWNRIAVLRGRVSRKQYSKALGALEKRYRTALGALIRKEAQDAVFFNLEFLPRAANEWPLFRKFVDSFMSTRGVWRLNLEGPHSGTRAITLDEQNLAEDMRRRGKGTEGGSIRFIAEEIRERRGVGPKKETALRQAVKRHLRRAGLIRRK